MIKSNVNVIVSLTVIETDSINPIQTSGKRAENINGELKLVLEVLIYPPTSIIVVALVLFT